MTEHSNNTSLDERRRGDRRPIKGDVTVRFPAQDVRGPGQNASEEGVFFLADGGVVVEVETEDGWRRGELVRIQNMGEGKIGVAVRFVDDAPSAD